MAKKKTSLVDAAKRLNASRESAPAKDEEKKAPAKPAAKQTRKSAPAKPKAPKSASKTTPKKGGASGGKSFGSRSRTSSASKKSNAPVKADDPREQIIAEVVEIARELDDAGLDLLLEQAKVVRYKGQIEEFNRQLNTAAAKAADRRRAANTPDYRVAIERNDDYFIIQMDDQRIFFNLDEMRELTRISHKAKDPAAGARLLFRWFEAERSDLLADAGINSARSPYLFELYEIIVSTYKVKS